MTWSEVGAGIRVSRKLKAVDVVDVLSDLFIMRGVPEHIRFDNGPEFIAAAVQRWIKAVGAKTAYEPSNGERTNRAVVAFVRGGPVTTDEKCGLKGGLGCSSKAKTASKTMV